VQRARAGGVGEQRGGDLAFPSFGAARHQATGIPSGIAGRWRERAEQPAGIAVILLGTYLATGQFIW
jgi:hypothetical protein